MMLRRTILGLAIGFSFLPVSYADSINQAVEHALSSNPRVLAQHYAVVADQQFVRQMQAQYWPTLDFTGGIGPEYSNNSTTRSSEGGSTNFTRKEGDIVLAEVLYDGGKRASQVGQKKDIKMYDEAKLDELKEAVAVATTKAYMNVIREQSIVEMYEKAIVENQKMVAGLEKGVDKGVSKASDAQLIRSMAAMNKTRLAEAKTRLSEAKHLYEQLVGNEPTKLMKPNFPVGLPKSEIAAWEASKNQNPSIVAAKNLVANAEEKIKESRADYFPTVTAEATANVGDQLDGVQGVNKSWSATLNMSYNLFAGGADYAETKGYDYQLKKANYDADEVMRNLKNMITDSFARVENDKSLVAELKSRADENKSVVDSFKKEFDLGNKNIIEVLTAENDYQTSQIEYINAYYTQYVDVYTLLANMGQLEQYFSSKK